MNKKLIDKTKKILDTSEYTVFFTGAGMSTASGIPDFRSPGTGLWERNDPYTVASLTAFQNTPEIFFSWIKSLYTQSKDAKPNSAHRTITELESIGKIQSVITQNIDGLHQKAGSKNVIELHGSVLTATCPFCQRTVSGEKLLEELLKNDLLPICQVCDRIIKPDVILYEEQLPQQAWHQAEMEMQKASAVFIAGSSLETYPANALPRTALSHGAKMVIITLSQTILDRYADVVIHEDVTSVLPQLIDHRAF